MADAWLRPVYAEFNQHHMTVSKIVHAHHGHVEWWLQFALAKAA